MPTHIVLHQLDNFYHSQGIGGPWARVCGSKSSRGPELHSQKGGHVLCKRLVPQAGIY
jgi:hypothetical protein